jgi:methionine aminopeptidase
VLCGKGDKLIEEEISKVYAKTKLKGSPSCFPPDILVTDLSAGFAHPTTISPATFVTPYTPLTSDEAEANVELQAGEPVKIQLGAQIDGFGTIVCDTVLVQPKDEKKDVVTGRPADLLLATHYANELLLRLILPPGLLSSGTDEEKAKATAAKAPTQTKISSMLEKVAKAYDTNLVESTTSWLFDRNEIEGKKKLVLAPGEGSKGEGIPEVGEVWGVEVGVSLSSGKVKNFDQRPTLHRVINDSGRATRPTSKKLMYDAKKNFNHFPFSLRQLESERDAKLGVLECVRNGLLRQYEVVGDKEGQPVARVLTTIGEHCKHNFPHIQLTRKQRSPRTVSPSWEALQPWT